MLRITIEGDGLTEPFVIDLPEVGSWNVNHRRGYRQVESTSAFAEYELLGSGLIRIEYEPELPPSSAWPRH